MKDEVKALQDNNTWKLVRPTTDRDVIPRNWVFTIKFGPSRQVGKCKARYVEGLDYFQTSAPNCKPETFRILHSISVNQGQVMHQFDVKTAFSYPLIEAKYIWKSHTNMKYMDLMDGY